MDRKRFIIIAGVALGVLVALLALAAFLGGNDKEEVKDSGPITLTYWRVFDDKEKFQPLIDEYEASHPNVKIEYRKLSFAEYQSTLVDAFADDRGPDMFMVNNAWLPRYFDRIEPISESKYKTADYQREFYAPAKETIRDGRIYALPLALDTLGLFANRDLESDTTPQTWEDLVGKPGSASKPSQLPQLNRRQGNAFSQSAITLGTNTVNRSADILSLLMLQYHTQMTNDERTQATFNLTQDVGGKQRALGREALEFYNSFANSRSPNYSWNNSLGSSVRAFAEGRVVYMVGYGFNAPTIERLNPELNYEIEPMLQRAGTTPVNYTSFWAETVNRDSKQQDAAWDFLRFLTSRDSMEVYNESTRGIPARVGLQASGNLDVLQEQLATATSWYKGNDTKADAIFTRMIDQMLRGESAQNVLDRAANELTVILRELNQPTP